MKSGYTIETNSFSKFHEKILVYNYTTLNIIAILPCILNTSLIDFKNNNLIGIWKIKQLKN